MKRKQKELTAGPPATPARHGTISIGTTTGPLVVHAEIWGYLAVHPSVHAAQRPWTVTHVPTGMIIRSFDEPTGARALVARIREAGLDLNFQTPADIPPATAAGLREICGTRGISITVSIEVKGL